MRYLISSHFSLCIPDTGRTVSTQLQVTVFSGASLFWHISHPSKTVPPTVSPQFLLHLEAAALKYFCVTVSACIRVLGMFSELWKILIVFHANSLTATETLPFVPSTISLSKLKHNRLKYILLGQFHN